jgi:hypothetical protein
MARFVHSRFSLYILLNFAFALLVGVLTAVGGSANPRLLYVLSLFALCSASVIDLDGLNGRYALLAMFMFVYFVSCALGDVSNLLPVEDVLESIPYQPEAALLSKTEAVILVGCSMWILGYRMAVFVMNRRRSDSIPLDWSMHSTLVVGVLFWVIGTIATYNWNVYIVPDITNVAFKKGIASIGPLVTSAYVLAQMLQPLGILLLAYALTVSRNPYLRIFFVGVIAIQVFIGFVVDIKGVAMFGIILALMTSLLVHGKIPKAWMVVGLMFVTLIYPYFTAYRAAIHGAGIARTTVVENFGEILRKTSAAKDKVNTGRVRAQTFLERANVKGSVELIVDRTGNGVEFQRGHTLFPILEAFVPRLFWSDKKSVPTGQLFNKQFQIAPDNDDVSMSPSNLGELYWNFGWPGVVLGMIFLGLLCGWVGTSFNLGEFQTVTRVLVMVITIKQLLMGFEGGIADNFVVWLRSIVGVGLLHLAIARVPAVSRLSRSTNAGLATPLADPSVGERHFPNLLT